MIFNQLTGERFDIIADIIHKVEQGKTKYSCAEHFRQRYLIGLMGLF